MRTTLDLFSAYFYGTAWHLRSSRQRSVASAKAIPATPSINTFWIIPHTPLEGAVFKTREEYLEIGMPHILRALELLRTHPEYRFVLDQVAYVKPSWRGIPNKRRFQETGVGRKTGDCGRERRHA